MDIDFIPLDNNVSLPNYRIKSTFKFPIKPNNIKRLVDSEVLSNGDIWLKPLGRAILGCGFRLKLPKDLLLLVGTYGKLASLQGLDVKLSTSFFDYSSKGEVCIIVTNLSSTPTYIKLNTKIGYGTFVSASRVEFNFPDIKIEGE